MVTAVLPLLVAVVMVAVVLLVGRYANSAVLADSLFAFLSVSQSAGLSVRLPVGWTVDSTVSWSVRLAVR